MKTALSLLLALLGSSLASGQIVAVAPFTGTDAESFEVQEAFQFTHCIEERVFNGKADLCSRSANGAIITGSWAFHCTLAPHSGARLFGSSNGLAEYTFDAPVRGFGGYFATNAGPGDGTARFFDRAGTLLASLPIHLAPDCTWTWNGWEAGGGPLIQSVQIVGTEASGGFVQMDDMRVDFGGPCAAPLAYCTAKPNSLNCLPSITSAGIASATATSGFLVLGAQVRNQQPGMLIYGVAGRAAIPFHGGTLCVADPIERTPAISSGGVPFPLNNCNGLYSIDMNAFSQGLLGGAPLPALRVPGTVVDCQWWGRDPGFPAPQNVSLTDGLEYAVCL